jgi:hypothetical protein
MHVHYFQKQWSDTFRKRGNFSDGVYEVARFVNAISRRDCPDSVHPSDNRRTMHTMDMHYFQKQWSDTFRKRGTFSDGVYEVARFVNAISRRDCPDSVHPSELLRNISGGVPGFLAYSCALTTASLCCQTRHTSPHVILAMLVAVRLDR